MVLRFPFTTSRTVYHLLRAEGSGTEVRGDEKIRAEGSGDEASGLRGAEMTECGLRGRAEGSRSEGKGLRRPDLRVAGLRGTG